MVANVKTCKYYAVRLGGGPVDNDAVEGCTTLNAQLFTITIT